MAQNRFKSSVSESSNEKEETKTKKRSRKKNKSERKLPFKKQIEKLSDFLKSEKTRQIFGLLLILFSAYLLIAFTSFLFTWKIDQSKVELPFWQFMMNSEIEVENWLGKLGAWLSHLFIFKWFGVISFLFVGIFFLFGFRILFKIQLLPLKRSLRISAFLLFWFALFFGFFFKDDLYFLGGAVGFELNVFLNSLLGTAGTGILVFFILIAFLLTSLNLAAHLKSIFSSNQKVDIEPETTVEVEKESEVEAEIERKIEDKNSDSIDEPEAVVESSINLDITTTSAEEEVVQTTEVEEEKNSNELEITKATEENQEEENEDDVSFEIEESAEKEDQLSDREVNDKVKEFGEYDPTLELSNYQMPGIELMKDHGGGDIKVDKEELEANKDRIVNTLENYNIKIQTIKATIGPTVTLYEIIPAPGVRISKIKNLEDDIALSLAALGIRIIAPIPGKGTIGIEVPNSNPDIVSMRAVIASEKFQNSKYDLPVVMGKTISNETYTFDLAKMPHLLMAGATGQGKSVGLNAILTSLLYKKHPAQLKFVLVDPKKVELTLYNKIERHFLAKLPDTEEAIITDNQKVINTLNSLCIEMDERYELLKAAFVRNIKEYNAKFIARKLNPENGHKYLPYIVLVLRVS